MMEIHYSYGLMCYVSIHLVESINLKQSIITVTFAINPTPLTPLTIRLTLRLTLPQTMTSLSNKPEATPTTAATSSGYASLRERTPRGRTSSGSPTSKTSGSTTSAAAISTTTTTTTTTSASSDSRSSCSSKLVRFQNSPDLNRCRTKPKLQRCETPYSLGDDEALKVTLKDEGITVRKDMA